VRGGPIPIIQPKIMGPIHRNDLVFVPLTEEDFPRLLEWLNSPHVAEQWDGAKSLEEVQLKYRDKLASDWQQVFIVSKNGERFGYIQSYRANRAGQDWWPGEPDTTVGIDQFIGDKQMLGKGLGTSMVREFSDWLLTQPNTLKVITDPSPTNSRAIACYRKAGFKDVGVVDTPEGQALLMAKGAG
jgi:aminoglycoside 6'-N-acetyltransferase-1b